MVPALWIFGYGSLVWRPSFPFSERRAASLQGFARRFWQGSTDHRGVPGAPGRVVTLEAAPGARCAGAAYRIPDERTVEVLLALDHRERGGYERLRVELSFAGGGVASGLVYVATPSNANWLGPAPLEAIAAQVVRAQGPSGANSEYVLRLAASLRELGEEDEHVFALERLVAGAQSRPALSA
ncbi:MAG TPA: gamma-glutamylcyclotransferase [Myxococcota bacterium]|nr:gamma-glutamylcyclotransferase [Myxococcota bacterium]